MASSNNKVGLADALRQRELDEQERDSSDGNGDWDDDAVDAPAKKSNVPARKLGLRPGERPAPAPPATRPASKPQPSGAASAEKRGQSDLDSSDASPSKSKSSRACESYEIDMAATEYGMCKCGFKKNEHVQGPMFRAAPRAMGSVYHPEVAKAAPSKPATFSTSEKTSPLESARKSFSPQQTTTKAPHMEHAEEPSDSKRPCDAFEVDLLSSEFGMCKCGFKKAQHSKSAQTAAPRRPSGLGFISVQAAEKLAQEERQREQEEAAKKAEEEARAKEEFMERERKLRELAADESESHNNQAAATEHGAAEPESDSGDVKRACDAFEIDLNAKEFGMCKCGFKKAEHTKTSLFSKPLPKPVHGYTPIEVPNVGKAVSKAHNRPPPAFATSAAPKPGPPPAKREEEPVAAPIETHEDKSEPQHEEVAEPETHDDFETQDEPVAAAESVAATEPETQAPPNEDADAPVAVLEVFDSPQLYKALYDYEGAEVEDLVFQAGEEIEVSERIDEDWMRGRIGDRSGVFPSNYVAKVEKEDSVADEEPAAVTQEEAPAEAEAAAEAEAEDAPVEAEPEPEPEAEPEPVAEPEPEPVAEEEAVDEAPIEETPAVEAQEEEPMIEETVAETIPVEEEAVAAEAQEGVPFTVYALYDFGATEEDLHFQSGDVIEVIAIVDDEWWRGTVDGREGIFPCNYVTKDASEVPAPVEDPAAAQPDTEAAPSGVLGIVEALYDMVVETEGDLNFRTGDRIEIIEVIDDAWYRGVLDGQEGNVPRNYVTELSS